MPAVEAVAVSAGPGPGPGPGTVAALRLALADGPTQQGGRALLPSTGEANLALVEFEPASTYHHQPDLVAELKAKYLLLRPELPHLHQHQHLQHPHLPGRNESEISLPSPKHVLFPVSSVRHGWRPSWQVGSGMQNIGNTCYLNSTLQAIFHVSAFANWLMSENHSDRCGQNGASCIICGMKKTLLETQNCESSIKPWQVYSKLRTICRHLVPGRQEDAHEFLRYLVEAMEKAYLSQFESSGANLDQYSKETTPLNQILGGYLRSAVKCLACNRVSTTFQHFQDLLVDARKASTIDEALDTFFSRERLEDLGYKCEFCNKKVSATKQFHIERAPMVLCIALKRFSITGGKVTKHVTFRPRLSLNKYMFKQNGAASLSYNLVSVVTHLGHSQNCGHYTAVGLGPGGKFYQFDDSSVREISISTVLNTNAYIMFYELMSPINGTNKNAATSTPLLSSQSYKENKETSTNFIGPIMPSNMKNMETTAKSLDMDKYPSGMSKLKVANDENKDTVLKEKLLNSPCLTLKLNGSKIQDIKQINGNNKQIVPYSLSLPSCSRITNGVVKISSLSPQSNPIVRLNGDQKIDENPKMNGNGNHHDSKSTENSPSAVQIKHLDNDKGKKSNGVSPLVPYDSESSGETPDDCEDDKKQPSTTSTSQGWKVSEEIPESRLTPKNKTNGENNDQTSMNDKIIKDRETLSQLHRQSHLGYGASVNTWSDTHSQLNRQVYIDKKSELKRCHDVEDDYDKGRNKKMRYNNNSYRYQNDRNNHYNAFQENQNQMNSWGAGGKHGYRKQQRHRNFKFKPRQQYNQHHSHHSNKHYRTYGRNH